jgi:hypothetical protein
MMTLPDFVLFAFGCDFAAKRIVERLGGCFGHLLREAAAIEQFACQLEGVDRSSPPAHSVNAPTLIATRNSSHALGTPPSVSMP